jgi:hypothetical protein
MRSGSRLAIATVLALLAAARTSAIEIGLELRSSNLHFPWTQTSAFPSGTSPYPATNFYIGGSAGASMPLGEDAVLRVSYERDQILRNMLSATVLFERGPAKISVGPLIGFLNSANSPISAGLTSSVRLQWPGVAYVSIRSDGGMSISIIQINSDPQAQSEIAAGFYARNAIVSAVVAAKRFNEVDAAGALVTDAWSRYALTIDIYKKNTPYTLLAIIGYEIRSKRYAATDTADSLGAIIIGGKASAGIAPGFELTANVSSGVYTFGLDELQGRSPPGSSFMFTASLGLKINTSVFLSDKEGISKVRSLFTPRKKESAVPATGQPATTAQPEAGAPSSP